MFGQAADEPRDSPGAGLRAQGVSLPSTPGASGLN